MKKSFFYAICVMVLATIVAVVSCKKDKQDETTEKCEQCAQATDNMDEYLISFKKKLLSAEKGGETMSIEQALNDMNNLLNFDFGDANHVSDEYVFDTIRTSLSVSAGQVDLSHLASVYNDAYGQVNSLFQQVDLPEKSVYAVLYNFDDSAKSNDENLEIVVITRGYRGTNPEDNYKDWRPTNKGGTCYGNAINMWGGPEQVANWLNNSLLPYGCDNGRVYFTNHGVSYVNGNNPALVDPASPCGYKLYVSNESDQSQVCLYDSELRYYYNQARALWFEYAGFMPAHPGHVPLYYRIVHSADNYYLVNGQYKPFPPFKWQLIVYHAKLNCTGPEM